MGRKPLDLAGQQFGLLTPLYVVGKDKHGHRHWICQCECGKKVSVQVGHLRSGDTVSCGCQKRERAHSLENKLQLKNARSKKASWR